MLLIDDRVGSRDLDEHTSVCSHCKVRMSWILFYIRKVNNRPASICRKCCSEKKRRPRKPTPSLEERLWGRIDRRGPDECWEWLGGDTGEDGYGAFRIDGRIRIAHRVVYELVYGRIPFGWHTDHLCRNVKCCNPLHLEAVTPRENILRGIGPSAKNARKTHCKNGHAFAGDNLGRGSRPRSDGSPSRKCRKCEQIWLASPAVRARINRRNKERRRERREAQQCYS